ncbi:sensor histidine kinase [Rehaibacterium terrae]|jgi:two-component system sensor histidine kinase AlgZ|uniref:Two-component system sensor histidine kinase AlgZ n=1 Tax=Rehaibacterium terrae TaxID=1341696 RepID=A0A7W8DDY8_9GAMM|nr:histidine kinase [Rehaibacterium terrae]MBB5015407.1 two-component system sensor histidine kinase AlgZ [Rehaibacterium terrae]
MPAPRIWLPDLCRLPRLAVVLGVAQLVVLVLALAPGEAGRWSPQRFAVASVFAWWVALTSAVLLCKLRAPLARLGRVGGIAAAWGLPVAVAALGALLVHEIDLGLGYGLSLPAEARGEFIRACALLTALIGAVALRYFYVTDQWQAQVQAQAKAEVQALQARIRPHFLFNSMNTIASLIRRDPATAERAVEDLAELFRAALGAGEGESTLAEELALIEHYLAIERLRLGERLRERWLLPADLPRDMRLPRLILQPLVENAVLHGIARLEQGGEVRIEAALDAGRLRLSVTNPAPPPRERDSVNGHAQESIRQRLAYRFGAKARMTADYRDGYYRCELLLPIET